MTRNDEVVSIAWHQDQPDQFRVTFQSGRNDLVSGPRAKAQALADDLGLDSATDETSKAEWIRKP
ncbi:MAG: hypothetical protein WAM97_03810 [Acidimicrobiales bacterium]